MKRINLLDINGVLFLLFGLSLVISPETFAKLYGSWLDGFGIDVARMWGVATGGVGLVCILAARSPDTLAWRAVIFGAFFINGGYAILYCIYVLLGHVSGLAWTNVVLHLLLSLVFGFLYIMGPPAPAATSESGHE